jgi:4-diphosphocytidyl-2-C-methyl-D-erythritol kinase
MVDPAPVRVARVEARAKVNLFLAVGGRRDDGYHEVTTVMQALELADTLTVSVGGAGVSLVADPDLGIPASDNLAFKAAVAFRESFGLSGGVSIGLAKRIPAGAGLGGGSADAAGVLAALSVLNAGSPADPRLARLASGLGADVAFFLGCGTQLMGGRGDEPLDVLPTPALDIVLIDPGVPVPTGAAYAQFDRMVRGAGRSVESMVAAVRSGEAAAVACALYDNMTEASCALVPEIRVALRFLEGSPGVLGAAMAGSGSTVFGVCADAESARECARRAVERGWWSRATAAADKGLVVTTDEDGTLL